MRQDGSGSWGYRHSTCAKPTRPTENTAGSSWCALPIALNTYMYCSRRQILPVHHQVGKTLLVGHGLASRPLPYVQGLSMFMSHAANEMIAVA
jgi:hypothetical protein